MFAWEKYLSKDQQALIIKEWNTRPDNPPSLKELIDVAFPGRNLDGRSVEGQAVKAFLASRQIQTNTSAYKAKGLLPLTEDQKEFIANHCHTMKPWEIARVLYKNDALLPVGQESRTVMDYVRGLNQKVAGEKMAAENYRPPKTEESVCRRITKYVQNPPDVNKLSPKQQKDVLALIGYLHTHRFIVQINDYSSVTDRELFESEFIRCTYDKGDLTEEDVDQYIIYSTEVVMGQSINRRIEQFNRKLDELLDNDEVFSKGLVDAVTSLRTEYNACIKRQQSLLSDLQGKRRERLTKLRADNASVTQLMEFWKYEEQRKKVLDYAELRRKHLKEEVGRIRDMNQLIIEVWGLDPEELINA